MTDDLKKLAEAVIAAREAWSALPFRAPDHVSGPVNERCDEAIDAFNFAATPAAILNLIRERDEARAEVARYKRKLMQGEAILAGWTRLDRIKLAAGEMTAQEARTVHAVTNAVVASVRSAIAADFPTPPRSPPMSDVEKVARAIPDAAVEAALSVLYGVAWPRNFMLIDRPVKMKRMRAAIEAALAAMGEREAVGPALTVTYRNYRGEVAVRSIIPKSVRFGSTEWHPEPQWLLLAFDTEKKADREFAMADMSASPRPEAVEEAVKAEDWRVVDDAIWFFLGHENHKPEEAARLRRMSGVVLRLAGEGEKG